MNDQTTSPTQNSAVAVADRFAGQLLRITVDALTQQRTPWIITPQAQQAEVLERVKSGFTEVILKHMRNVCAADMPHAEVMLQNIAAKGDSVKITVSVSERKVLHELIDFLGRKTTLVLADLEVFTAGMESFAAQADQPELPLGDDAEAA